MKPEKHPAQTELRSRWLYLIYGLLTGLMLHYVCYRISLPSTPFIYTAF